VSQKNVQNCFCHKFVKCLPTLIIFSTQIAQGIGLCEVHRLSTASAILLSAIFSVEYSILRNYYITWRPLSNRWCKSNTNNNYSVM